LGEFQILFTRLKIKVLNWHMPTNLLPTNLLACIFKAREFVGNKFIGLEETI
jgi:hypothetical protein